jgi:hypothetical protein
MTPTEFSIHLEALIASAEHVGLTERELAVLLREAVDELLSEPPGVPPVFLVPPQSG